MPKYSTLMILLSKLFIAISFSAFCVLASYIAAKFVYSGQMEFQLLEKFGLDLRDRSREDRSYDLIYSDHNSVTSWLLNCVGASKFDDLPEESKQFLTPFIFLSYNDENTSKLRPFFAGERVLGALSKDITMKRVYWSAQANGAYSQWQFATWITISIGMLTTIFVSLSTTEFGRGEGTTQRVVRTLAVVFPALGTAAAAIVGFYGPQADWSQASRSLASLSQLHGQLAIEIWKQNCIKSPGDQNEIDLKPLLEGWSKRYIDIETLSNTSNTAAATTPGTSDNSSDKSRVAP
ncbi:hypothetical protein [Mesorhizobium huakuii]|uniref:DUF4231 domain-containing protein n=1 Tax=Mesorhizobium huakuii TaxID=28104 RepID=A0A7G6SSJ8_9HYPH|nr:hypothetical protein [Mesorhizobium huakuii]QND57480.1 hypothetical protein HB778_13275 [Mesorhizobium huakuii]